MSFWKSVLIYSPNLSFKSCLNRKRLSQSPPKRIYNRTEVASNTLLITEDITVKKQKHNSYLQSIFNLKLFTKDIKNANQQSLGLLVQSSMRIKGGGVQSSRSKYRTA